jgi:hypothetical protein
MTGIDHMRTHAVVVQVVEAEPALHPHLIEALGMLVQISRTDDMETFKICLEFWLWLVSAAARLHAHAARPGLSLTMPTADCFLAGREPLQ